MINLLTPKNGACVSLLSANHKEYLDGAPTAARTSEDDSLPLPVLLTYSPAADGQITVTRKSDGVSQVYSAVSGSARIYNLRIGEEYEWQVKIGLMESETRIFKTDDQAPRMIRADGISNVRDVGGYLTTDGKRIRQGLLFRSSEMDCHFTLTNAGKRTICGELGIRTDIDLRGVNGEIATPALGDSVMYVNLPISAYGDIFTDKQKRLYKQAFELLANENIYPAIVHCWSGTDRTGTLCYILGALLGIDEGELDLDYEMSSFSVCGERSVRMDSFTDFRKKFFSYGASAKKAAENFLADCGVKCQTVEAIRKIFTVVCTDLR